MTRKRVLGFIAVAAAVGFTLAAPGEAFARRRCCRGRQSYYGATYAVATPVTGSCAPNAAPVNPDGTMTPQPGNAPPAPAAPNAPAPQGTSY